MHRGPWLAVALLALGGCYAPPQNADYGNQTAYPTASYPPPEYPPGVYPAAPYDPNVAAYPGYGYGGAPTIIEEGVPVPLVLLGNEWGYYDRERHWHRAPDDVRRRWEERREGRPEFRRDAPRFGEGFGRDRPEGRPAPFGGRPGAASGVFPEFRPNEQARPLPPPAAPSNPTPFSAPGGVFSNSRPSPPPAAPSSPAPFNAPGGVLSNFRPSPPPPASHSGQICPPGQRC